MQWAKYIRLFYNSGIEKLKSSLSEERVSGWCKENGLEEKFKEPAKDEELKKPETPKPQIQKNVTHQKIIPSKNKSSSVPFKKQVKKTKSFDNEIDDIFGGI